MNIVAILATMSFQHHLFSHSDFGDITSKRPSSSDSSVVTDHFRGHCTTLGCSSGVHGSVTLGDGMTQRGRYPGGRKYPVGSRGEDPIGGLVDEPLR